MAKVRLRWMRIVGRDGRGGAGEIRGMKVMGSISGVDGKADGVSGGVSGQEQLGVWDEVAEAVRSGRHARVGGSTNSTKQGRGEGATVARKKRRPSWAIWSGSEEVNSAAGD